MDNHGTRTTPVNVSFYSFRGDDPISRLDGITLPPAEFINPNTCYHTFAEWLKREGHDWRHKTKEALCRLAVDYFNLAAQPGEELRRFDRMANA